MKEQNQKLDDKDYSSIGEWGQVLYYREMREKQIDESNR